MVIRRKGTFRTLKTTRIQLALSFKLLGGAGMGELSTLTTHENLVNIAKAGKR